MLYDAEGNIGQVKRDLKLVCAKSFYITERIMRKTDHSKRRTFPSSTKRTTENQRNTRTPRPIHGQ